MYMEDIEQAYSINKIFDCLNRIEEFFEVGVIRTRNQESNDFREVSIFILRKSIVTTREVATLCKEGFPDGAMSLARNVFEQFIILLYLRAREGDSTFDDMIARYMDDYTVQRNKALKFEAENVRKSKEEAEKYEEEINEIKAKYNVSSVRDYWWSNKNSFQDICDTVASENSELQIMIRSLQVYYKRACLSLHSSYMGNIIRLGSTDVAVDMGPWDKGQEIPLYLCAVSLPAIVGIVFNLLEIGKEDIQKCTKELNRLAKTYITIGRLRKQFDSKQ